MHLVENDQGGVVFIWGMAAWCWERDDVVGRRLAAVSLVETEAAGPGEVATAFGVTYETVRQWRQAWSEAGTEALVPQKPGPRGPSKLTEEVRERVRQLAGKGMGLLAIAREVGLDPSTVRRALPDRSAPVQRKQEGSLAPLAQPLPREDERALARAGVLLGAEPVVTEGASLPFAGALLVLPALAATGLLDAFAEVYGAARAAFYSLRALVLTIVFCALLGEARAQGLTRLGPADIGRLIGLDRAPEVGTLRRRMEELAAPGRSAELLRALARRHVDAAADAAGMFYIDGHVRAYHGSSRLPKAHLARARLSAPAEVDTWVCDKAGQGVLVWSTPPGASLAGELKRAIEEIRQLVGPEARPTVVFDRGGWSPKLFAELVGEGFHLLTYRKGKSRPEPRSGFRQFELVDDLGRPQSYWLADRPKRFSYKEANRGRYFAARQVTRLDKASGHQTQVVTTREDLSAPEVAYWCFCRWRQENFFRYMRSRLGLDALDSYAKVADDPARTVPNPAKARAAKRVKKAKAAQASAEAALAKAVSAGTEGALAPKEANEATAAATKSLEKAKDAVASAKEAQGKVPARVPLGELHPDAARLAPERKRLHDATRMATYNATSALARLLGPHYARAEDEARTLLAEAFRSPADLEVIGDELHVRLDGLSAPRRTRAIAALCEELNATETTYPGTKLRLVYSMKGSGELPATRAAGLRPAENV